jgi:aminoglycoside phosphotransferase (APT) family kinase protein
LPDEIKRIRSTGKMLQLACPHLTRDLEAIVQDIVSNLEEVPLRPSHLDLKTDHILLDGDRATLLDFDSFAQADPVLDAARMLAQIFAMQFRFSVEHARLRMTARTFYEEYFNHVPGTWSKRLRTDYAGAVLKVALGFFRRQNPQWPETVAALLAEAKTSLAGQDWWWTSRNLASS